MTTRPTVVVAVHDGVYGCGTGAGHANLGFLHTLIHLLPEEVHLVVLPVWLAPASPEHHAPWRRQAQTLLDAAKATVLPVHNGTDGLDRWGGLPNFRHLARDTASRIIEDVLPSAEPILIIAFDVPFLGLAAALPKPLRDKVILVPRSSGAIHTPHDVERITWEHAQIRAATAAGTRIAAISPFMAAHLRRQYKVPERLLVQFHDGLTAPDWIRLTSPRPTPVAVPDRFVLAMGRAEPYKGFPDVVDAYALLRGDVPPLVLAATTEGTHRTPHQRDLAERAAAHGIDVVFLNAFGPDVRSLLRHPGLRAVVVPSHAEPFGRVPMECFAAGSGPVVASTAQGLAGQVSDGVTGFTFPPGEPALLAAALTRALTLPADDRRHMLRRATDHALRDYDHPAAVRRLLPDHAPWLGRYGRDHRLRWPGSVDKGPGSAMSTVSTAFTAPPVKAPVGLQARHWNTIRAERTVLVVAHHVTSLVRLLDVITVFDSDLRVQVVFSCNGSDPFLSGLDDYLHRLGVVTIPWQQAINLEFDLIIAANHGGLTETNGPLVILPHGAGYTKNSPGEPESRRAGEPESRRAGEPESRRAGVSSVFRQNGCCTTANRSRPHWFSRTTTN